MTKEELKELEFFYKQNNFSVDVSAVGHSLIFSASKLNKINKIPNVSYLDGRNLNECSFYSSLPVRNHFPVKTMTCIRNYFYDMGKFEFNTEDIPSIHTKSRPKWYYGHYTGFELLFLSGTLLTGFKNPKKERIYDIDCKITDENFHILHDICIQRPRRMTIRTENEDMLKRVTIYIRHIKTQIENLSYDVTIRSPDTKMYIDIPDSLGNRIVTKRGFTL